METKDQGTSKEPKEHLNIGVVGCSHGDLDVIYETCLNYQDRNKCKLDLLICCGDFEVFFSFSQRKAVRNQKDLDSMAVPLKYREMKDFHKYYDGTKVAPILTIFIGGNHEAATHLHELYIYFLQFLRLKVFWRMGRRKHILHGCRWCCTNWGSKNCRIFWDL